MNGNDSKFALLIDAENISNKYAKIIMSELAKYGSATYRRLYGDFTGSPNINWTSDDTLKYCLTPIQQFSYTKGSNSSDITLVIDAMDIMYTQKVDGVCLVTSDSDFTRLAMRLREQGIFVLGMGEGKTPLSLRKACDKFILLDYLYKNDYKVEKETARVLKQTSDKAEGAKQTEKSEPPKSSAAVNEVKPKKAVKRVSKTSKREEPKADPTQEAPKNDAAEERNDPEIMPSEKIAEVVKNSILPDLSNDDGWANLADVGNRLSKLYADFDCRNYGYTRLNLFFKDKSDFEVEGHRGATGATVYMIRAAQDKNE